MLKVIRCAVLPGAVARFAAGQARWLELATIDGFVAQLGGWSRDAERTAVIVAIWRDRPSYDSFMRLHHDRIASVAKQSGNYADLTVELVEGMPAVDVEGARSALTIERDADGSVRALTAGARAAVPGSELVAIEPTWTVVAARHVEERSRPSTSTATAASTGQHCRGV